MGNPIDEENPILQIRSENIGTAMTAKQKCLWVARKTGCGENRCLRRNPSRRVVEPPKQSWMDREVRKGEKPWAQQKDPGKPKNLCSYRNAWRKKPSARQGRTPGVSLGSPVVPSGVKREIGIVNTSEPPGLRDVHERLGIHNQDGAKRGSARGKPLEKPRTWVARPGGDRRRKSAKEVVPPCNS